MAKKSKTSAGINHNFHAGVCVNCKRLQVECRNVPCPGYQTAGDYDPAAMAHKRGPKVKHKGREK